MKGENPRCSALMQLSFLLGMVSYLYCIFVSVKTFLYCTDGVCILGKKNLWKCLVKNSLL